MSTFSVANDMLKKTGKTIWNNKVNSFFLYQSYADARQEGQGKIGAGITSAVDNALMLAMPMKAYLGLQLAMEAPELITKGVESINTYGRSLSQQNRGKAFQNASFTDNQQFSTMRQQGMDLAKKSKYALQQTLMGNEAQYLHR